MFTSDKEPSIKWCNKIEIKACVFVESFHAHLDSVKGILGLFITD